MIKYNMISKFKNVLILLLFTPLSLGYNDFNKNSINKEVKIKYSNNKKNIFSFKNDLSFSKNKEIKIIGLSDEYYEYIKNAELFLKYYNDTNKVKVPTAQPCIFKLNIEQISEIEIKEYIEHITKGDDVSPLSNYTFWKPRIKKHQNNNINYEKEYQEYKKLNSAIKKRSRDQFLDTPSKKQIYTNCIILSKQKIITKYLLNNFNSIYKPLKKQEKLNLISILMNNDPSNIFKHHKIIDEIIEHQNYFSQFDNYTKELVALAIFTKNQQDLYSIERYLSAKRMIIFLNNNEYLKETVIANLIFFEDEFL